MALGPDSWWVSSYTASFMEDHRPDLYTQLLLKTSRCIYSWEPEAEADGLDRWGRILFCFWSTVAQLLMMGIKDCWVLWVHQPLYAQVRSKEVVGMGVEVSTPIPLLQDTHKRASLFWKHAGKKRKIILPWPKRIIIASFTSSQDTLAEYLWSQPSWDSDFWHNLICKYS